MAQKWAQRMVALALGLALAAALTVALAGFGYRWGLWDLNQGFALLPYGAYCGGGAAILSLAGGVFAALVRARAAAAASFLGIALGGAALAFPLDLQMRAKANPPIHDISTDTVNAPPFVALKALRDGSPNGSAYGGAGVSIQQKQAYPDIVPLRSRFKPADVLARARSIARELGWEVVAETKDGFEASVTSAWWGFVDDVVVRLRVAGDETILDLRSASRLGSSDLGVNAKRVRAFMARFQHRMENER